MADQHKIADDTTVYTWSTTIQAAAGQTMNGFWCYHTCGSLTDTIQLLGSGSFPATSSISSESGSNDGWTFLYLDSSDNLWVPNDWQAGTDSGNCNAPDYDGTLSIEVDTSSSTVTLTFTYDNRESPTVYTLSGFKAFNKLTGSA